MPQQHSKESTILICKLFTASRTFIQREFASVWIKVKEKRIRNEEETRILCRKRISERRQQIECAHVPEMED